MLFVETTMLLKEILFYLQKLSSQKIIKIVILKLSF